MYTLKSRGHRLQGQPCSNEAKLKVKFYVPPFLPIIPRIEDYRVLCLDADDQYALVCQPSRKYLWILSRQSHMDDDTYNQLVQKAEEGYDVSNLHKTPQSDTPPE
ncbi:hypothetical protein NL676_036315 [Syzygium grande]|nr:hypothetical protein NL676_036315 [Syzygium grande]